MTTAPSGHAVLSPSIRRGTLIGAAVKSGSPPAHQANLSSPSPPDKLLQCFSLQYQSSVDPLANFRLSVIDISPYQASRGDRGNHPSLACLANLAHRAAYPANPVAIAEQIFERLAWILPVELLAIIGGAGAPTVAAEGVVLPGHAQLIHRAVHRVERFLS